jgi:hypothetical protein
MNVSVELMTTRKSDSENIGNFLLDLVKAEEDSIEVCESDWLLLLLNDQYRGMVMNPM